MKKLLALSPSGVVFIMLINVKMPTIVGILAFMSRIKKIITSGPGFNIGVCNQEIIFLVLNQNISCGCSKKNSLSMRRFF